MVLEDLCDGLTRAGVKRGDVMVVGSNARRLVLKMMYEDRAAGRAVRDTEAYLDDIIDSLKGVVGDDGTLLFHTFYWAFCHDGPFDYDNTPGETGMLSNRALFRGDFRRTTHPIYSFAVCGKDTDLLIGMSNIDAFDADSPFAYMHEKDAAYINIDVPAFTFFHYVEQCCNVEYRFKKLFTAPYIRDGVSEIKTYSMVVRYLCLDVKMKLFWDDFLDERCKTMIYPQGIETYVIRCAAAYDQIADDIMNNDAANLVTYSREMAAAGLQHED